MDADDWIDHADASAYALVEDSIGPREGLVLTLLWWKDESQITALDNEDEGTAALDGRLSFRSSEGAEQRLSIQE